mmetsp:Transcript_16760/g.20294  ORF Transcript_16760/g.20294 Transcript_16760/m.20294 type:complete len:678 (+) Transcript_16760:66-2099(+)
MMALPVKSLTLGNLPCKAAISGGVYRLSVSSQCSALVSRQGVSSFVNWNLARTAPIYRPTGVHAPVSKRLLCPRYFSSISKASPKTKTESFFSRIFKPSSNARQMIQFAEPAKKQLILGILFLPPALGATMALPYFVGEVIDTVMDDSGEDNSGRQKTLIATLLAFSVFGALATCGRSYFINLSSEIIVKNMRANLFSAIMRKPIFFFDKSKTGDLVNRISSDTTIVSNTLTESVSMALRGVSTTIVGTGFLFYTCPNLALVSTGTLLPLLLLGRFYGNFIKSETRNQLEVFGRATSVAEESISNARVVKLFNRKDYVVGNYETDLEETFNVGKSIAKYRGVFMGSSSLVFSLSMLSVLGYGSSMVANGLISPGELTSFLLYAVNVTGAAFQITNVYSAVMRALGASERILEVSNSSEISRENTIGTMSVKQNDMSIVFKDVTFAYPMRPDSTILNSFNLTIPNGKVVAVLGGSGSGKSTLVSLLGRLYRPNSGEILLGGQKLNELDIASLRNTVGVVTQDPVVFMQSIEENIRFGNLNASKEQVIQAAKLANIHDFIETLPDGYDTLVGERGSQLSGGQKQRVCIARAIIKDPKILVLDEATSSLDVENEYLVQQALDRLMPGRTTIIITHRLSTIENADYIAVLEDGSVVEYGTKDEITQKTSGKFHDFMRVNKS